MVASQPAATTIASDLKTKVNAPEASVDVTVPGLPIPLQDPAGHVKGLFTLAGNPEEINGEAVLDPL
jgi:hypothetical protein